MNLVYSLFLAISQGHDHVLLVGILAAEKMNSDLNFCIL